jgi:hypothetical protein
VKINEKEAPLCDARYHRENSTLRPCRDVDGPRAETSNHHESATFFFRKAYFKMDMVQGMQPFYARMRDNGEVDRDEPSEKQAASAPA